MASIAKHLDTLKKKELVEIGAALSPPIVLDMNKHTRPEMIAALLPVLEGHPLKVSGPATDEDMNDDEDDDSVLSGESLGLSDFARPEDVVREPEDIHVLYAMTMPEVSKIIAEQLMPRLTVDARAEVETWLIFAILFRWVRICGDRKRDPIFIYNQATRPTSAVGKNFRMNLRHCVNQEMWADANSSVRESVLMAIDAAIAHELLGRSDVESGRARCAVLLKELEVGSLDESSGAAPVPPGPHAERVTPQQRQRVHTAAK